MASVPPPVRAECLYQFDPPMVRVYIAEWPLGDVPIHDYQRVRGLFPLLPDVVCDGPVT